MKAKDIEVGKVYAVEVDRPWRGRAVLGQHVKPMRVTRVEKSPEVSKFSHGFHGARGGGFYGGEYRAYGVLLNPDRVNDDTGAWTIPTHDCVLAKVLRLWNDSEYRAQKASRDNTAEVKRRDDETVVRLANALIDKGVGVSVVKSTDTKDGYLMIHPPSYLMLARLLGVTEP